MPSDTNPPTPPDVPDVLDAARAWVAEAEWSDTFEDRMTAAFDQSSNGPEMKALMMSDDGDRWRHWCRHRAEDPRDIIPALIAEVTRLRSLVARTTGQTWPKPPGEIGPPF